MPEYFKIGKFITAHGLKGELILRHQLGKKTSLKGLETIFIEQPANSFLPWFVESTRMKAANEVLMKLEGILTREDAIRLVQKEAWCSKTDLERFSAKRSPIHLLGYTIVSQKKKLGEVLEIIEQPHQLLCRIEINKKEVLIPLNEASLKKIDHGKKELNVSLPEGLLEVYLDGSSE